MQHSKRDLFIPSCDRPFSAGYHHHHPSPMHNLDSSKPRPNSAATVACRHREYKASTIKITDVLKERFLRLPLDSEVEKKKMSKILEADSKKRAKMIPPRPIVQVQPIKSNDRYQVERAVLACFRSAGQQVSLHPFVAQPGTFDWLPGQDDGAPPVALERMCRKANLELSTAMPLISGTRDANKRNNEELTDHDKGVYKSTAAAPPLQFHGKNKPLAQRQEWIVNYAVDPPFIEKEGFRISSKGIVFAPSDLTMIPKEFEPTAVKIEDEESFPGVWASFDTENERWYAVKKYKIMDEEERCLMIDELRTLHQLLYKDYRTSPLPIFYGAYLHRLEIHLVFEWPEEGSISSIMWKRQVSIPESILSVIVRMVLVALSKLHSIGRVHNAITTSNIWLFASGQVKVAGLGHCTYFETTRGDTTKKCQHYRGPTHVMAPERLVGLESTPLSDVWSLGLTVIEMATGRFPYETTEQSPQEHKWRVVDGPIPNVDSSRHSSKLVDFCMFCLKKNPQYRHGVQQLLRHPFIMQHEDMSRRECRKWLKGKWEM